MSHVAIYLSVISPDAAQLDRKQRSGEIIQGASQCVFLHRRFLLSRDTTLTQSGLQPLPH